MVVSAITVAAPQPSGAATPSCLGGQATIIGSARNETLTGTSGNDVISAGGGDDIVLGRGGNDKICGGGGTDIIDGGAGNDKLDGGPGIFDIANFSSATGPVGADLAHGIASGEGSDSLRSVEGLAGSRFNDTLLGDGTVNLLVGGMGNDRLDGKGGTDFIGFLTIGAQGVSANLSTGTASGQGSDTLVSDEAVIATNNADHLTGDAGDNILGGGAGNDTIHGGQGDDRLFGDAGTDSVYGEDGIDQLVGGPGNDMLAGGADRDNAAFLDSPAGVNANLASGTATGNGADVLRGVEALIGSGFNDTLTGDSRENNINGLTGDDTLAGAAGDDIVVGGGGTDALTGGTGHDVCTTGESLTSCEYVPPAAATATNSTVADSSTSGLRTVAAHLQTLGETSSVTPQIISGGAYMDIDPAVECPSPPGLFYSPQVDVKADWGGYAQTLTGNVPEGYRLWEQVTLFVWDASSKKWVSSGPVWNSATGNAGNATAPLWFLDGGPWEIWSEYGQDVVHLLGNASHFWHTNPGYYFGVAVELWLTPQQNWSNIIQHRYRWAVNFTEGTHRDYYCSTHS
jgi:hypothetical protein